MIRCFRCSGQKTVFKFGIGDGGYTLVDMGGEKVDCPMCMGSGMIEPIDIGKGNYKNDTQTNRGNKKKSVRPNEVRDKTSNDL